MHEETKILPTPVPVERESSSMAPKIVAAVLVAIIAAVFFYMAWRAEGQRIAEAGKAPSVVVVAEPPERTPLPEPQPPEPVVEPEPVVVAAVAEPEPEPKPEPVPEPRREPKPAVAKPVAVRDTAREEAIAEAARVKREEEKRRQDEAVAKLAAMHAEAERKAEAAKAAALAAVEAPAEPVPAVAKEPSCMSGMRLVSAGSFRFGAPDSDDLKNFGDIDQTTVSVAAYCIDAYEYPNRARGRPTTGVTFTQAASACKARNKRLCTEQEWERACKGTTNARFPYGKDFDGDACNTEDADGQARVATFSGAYARCVSAFGVVDLAGNVAEWVDASFDDGDARKAVKGGNAERPDFATRCAARVGKAVATKDPLIGFRCCSDPQ